MPHRVVFICCVLLVLSACRSVDEVAQSPLFDNVMAHHPASNVDDENALPLSTRSLRDIELEPLMAQQLALLSSPRVRAALSGLGVASAERMQVSLLANPGFSIKAVSPNGEGSWKTEFALTLGLLDWMLRPLREQIAEEEYAAHQLAVWMQVRDALTDVQQAYFAAVAAQQRAIVVAGMQHVAGLNADLAQAMRDAGNLSELDTLRHQAEADRQQRNADAAAELAARAQRHLLRELGLPQDTRLRLPAALPAPFAAPPATSRLVSEALQRRVEPELILRRQQALQREQQRVARQQGVASVDIGVLSEREASGDWHPGIRAALQLPLNDRGQARQSALLAQWQQLQAEHDASVLQIEQQVLDASAAMLLAQRQAELLHDEEIPRWQRMIELALREYNFMLSGTFDLLTIKQHSLAAQLAHVDSLQAYWRARAELALASGNALVIDDDWPGESDDATPPASSLPDSHGEHHHD